MISCISRSDFFESLRVESPAVGFVVVCDAEDSVCGGCFWRYF